MIVGNIVTDITGLVGIPAGITGIGIALYLWLGGRVKLVSDCEAEKKALKERHEAEEALIMARLDAVIADRDAWRTAHGAEVEARMAAERAATALLDRANIASQLLDALKQELRRPR